MTPVQGVEDVVPGIVNPGGPPYHPLMRRRVGTPKKKKKKKKKKKRNLEPAAAAEVGDWEMGLMLLGSSCLLAAMPTGRSSICHSCSTVQLGNAILYSPSSSTAHVKLGSTADDACISPFSFLYQKTLANLLVNLVLPI